MPRTIKIQRGENLTKISKREKTTIPEILRLNLNIKDRNRIKAGADLILPDLPGAAPATTATITPAGTTSGGTISSVVKDRATPTSDRDAIIERLTGALTTKSEFDKGARLGELEEERGLEQKRETVGRLEEELSTTLSFLDNLEQDITERVREGGFLQTEAQRRRQLASERAPLTKELGSIERTLGTAETALAREEDVIGQLLDLEEESARGPLESLLEETQLRTEIDKLFPDQGLDKVAPIVGAIEEVGNDPVEIFNRLREEGITNVGINDIVEVIEGIQSVEEDEEINTQVVKSGGRNLLINTQTGETVRDLGATEGSLDRALEAVENQQNNAGKTVQDLIAELPSAGERDRAAAGVSLFISSKELLDTLDNAETGPLSGRLRAGQELPFLPDIPGAQSLPFKATRKSEAFDKFQAASTIFTANFIKSISGAQVSDRERQFLMKALPGPNKQERLNRTGIKTLLDFTRNNLFAMNINADDFPEIFDIGSDIESDFEQFIEE